MAKRLPPKTTLGRYWQYRRWASEFRADIRSLEYRVSRWPDDRTQERIEASRLVADVLDDLSQQMWNKATWEHS